MTFSEWFLQFHEAYCIDVIAYDKQREYMYIYQKHYQPLYRKPLTHIRPIDVQLALKSTIGYSNDRQRAAYFLLKRVFREAIVNGYCDKNPVEYVKPPKRIRKEAEYFDPDTLVKLFDSDDKVSLMFQLDLWTGLRRGELLALTWDNIDLDRQVIHVCQTLVHKKAGDEIVRTTKSRNDRLVPIHKKADHILRRIRDETGAEGFLFLQPGTDKVISLRQFNRLYRSYYLNQRKKYPDLIYLSPHKLRHSYATYLIQSGADIETLRALLGHVDIGTTQRYVHSNFKQMEKAVNNLKFE